MSQIVPEGMVAIVNTPTNMYCVREDLAKQFIPCMACQGAAGGEDHLHLGNLWIDGWSFHRSRFYRCRSCWGTGVVKIVTPPSCGNESMGEK